MRGKWDRSFVEGGLGQRDNYRNELMMTEIVFVFSINHSAKKNERATQLGARSFFE